ncbi:MAG: hypothetical protein M3Q31_12380 [Actinomycetota bacterium]|nr:hypothetical protein [Actinomycetota bacterium]
MTLERELRDLAAGLPDPPDITSRVLVAMRERSARRRRRRVVFLAIAVFLLAPATALAFSPDLRDRVLETFGLRSVTVERVKHIPTVSPAARSLQLGSRISLTQARSALQVRFHSPRALGAPDAIFEDDLQAGVDVTLLYEPGTVAARLGVHRRVLVSILRGTLDKQLIGKTIGTATTARQFRLDGGQALLLTGQPHIVVIFRHGSTIETTSTRLAGNTLLWQRRALLVRIEGNLREARLIAIARSFWTG